MSISTSYFLIVGLPHLWLASCDPIIHMKKRPFSTANYESYCSLHKLTFLLDAPTHRGGDVGVTTSRKKRSHKSVIICNVPAFLFIHFAMPSSHLASYLSVLLLSAFLTVYFTSILSCLISHSFSLSAV